MTQFICGLAALSLIAFTCTAHAQQVHIVAIGDSNFAGLGVSRNQAYPAQLERALRAKGVDAVVANAGINGDTTSGVLARLNSSVPNGTDLAIVSVGINDVVMHGQSMASAEANIREIERRLRARGIEVLILPTGKQFQGGLADKPAFHIEGLAGASGPTPGKTNWHLTGEGYAIIAAHWLPEVLAAIERAKQGHKI
jgi:acyl-CoA thioesterase I